MPRAVVRIRKKAQITLPQEVREALHVKEGDSVAFTLTDEGTVVISGLKAIPAEQAWLWTEEWQAGEREASQQAARGEGTVHENAEDFLDSLR